MRTYPDCIPCLLRQALSSLKHCGADEELSLSCLKQILRCALDFEMKESPPEMAMYIHRIIRAALNNEDPYRNLKRQAIEEVLRHETKIRALILRSSKPLETAIRFAIAGNVLDFALYEWNPEHLSSALDSALNKALDLAALSRLENAISKASSVMLIGDNAGESVFDRLLIEQMLPKKVFYAVRGRAAINDVTWEEALYSGLERVSTLIGNGSDAPGTLLEHVSDEFMRHFKSCDLIIAKGQGNYESLCGAERKIFFLTQIKCPVIARDLKGRVGDWVIKEGGGAVL